MEYFQFLLSQRACCSFFFFFFQQFLAVVFFGVPLCSFAVSDTALWFDIDWNGGSQVEALEELKVSFQFCDRNDLSQRLRNGGSLFALRTETDLIACKFQRQGDAQLNKCRTCTIGFCAFLSGERKKKWVWCCCCFLLGRLRLSNGLIYSCSSPALRYTHPAGGNDKHSLILLLFILYLTSLASPGSLLLLVIATFFPLQLSRRL